MTKAWSLRSAHHTFLYAPENAFCSLFYPHHFIAFLQDVFLNVLVSSFAFQL
jgi:hypothetical protein